MRTGVSRPSGVHMVHLHRHEWCSSRSIVRGSAIQRQARGSAARLIAAVCITFMGWQGVMTPLASAMTPQPPSESQPVSASEQTQKAEDGTPAKADAEVAASNPRENMAITVRRDQPARASRDGRVSYGEFSISRPRFEVRQAQPPTTEPRVEGTATSSATSAASGSDPSVIAVPSNTLVTPGEATAGGESTSRESLQARRDREAAERKRLGAEADEAAARAELARLDAANYERNTRRPTVIVGGRGYYSGARHGHAFIGGPRAARPPRGLVSGDTGAPTPGEFTVTRQRFKGTKAQSEFARAASRDDIVPIQRRIDAAVRGNRLELEPVEEE